MSHHIHDAALIHVWTVVWRYHETCHLFRSCDAHAHQPAGLHGRTCPNILWRFRSDLRCAENHRDRPDYPVLRLAFVQPALLRRIGSASPLRVAPASPRHIESTSPIAIGTTSINHRHNHNIQRPSDAFNSRFCFKQIAKTSHGHEFRHWSSSQSRV